MADVLAFAHFVWCSAERRQKGNISKALLKQEELREKFDPDFLCKVLAQDS